MYHSGFCHATCNRQTYDFSLCYAQLMTEVVSQEFSQDSLVKLLINLVNLTLLTIGFFVV